MVHPYHIHPQDSGTSTEEQAEGLQEVKITGTKQCLVVVTRKMHALIYQCLPSQNLYKMQSNYILA